MLGKTLNVSRPGCQIQVEMGPGDHVRVSLHLHIDLEKYILPLSVLCYVMLNCDLSC